MSESNSIDTAVQIVPKVPNKYGPVKDAQVSPDLNAIWTELMGLKRLVENEHDRKLRRIETDLRWTMMLVGAQFVTIIGSAIATLVGS